MASGGRFTIRQIYHLTELRRSGLSKEQIMLGLEEIECLRNETADLSFSNIIEPSTPPTTTPTNIISSSTTTTTTTNKDRPKIAGKKRNYQQLLAELSVADSPSSQMGKPPAAQVPRMSRMTTPASLPCPPKVVKKQRETNNTPAGCLIISGGGGGGRGRPPNKKDGGPSIPMQNMGKSVSWAEVEDLDPRVRDLLERDVCQVRDELQKFITEFRIRQASIVRESNSRLSQPYLSTWLHTPHSKNFRKVRVLYEWYIEAQRRVKRDGGFISLRQMQKDALRLEQLSNSNKQAIKAREDDESDTDNSKNTNKSTVSSSTTTVSTTPTTHNQQKEEKQSENHKDTTTPSKSSVSPIPATNDLWPSACESFLEEAFHDNLHPNFSARKVIAEGCTLLIGEEQQKQGIEGQIPQMVTANQVCVWYINRRKEHSRRHSFELQITTPESSPRIYPILSPTPSSFRSTSPDELMKIKDDLA